MKIGKGIHNLNTENHKIKISLSLDFRVRGVPASVYINIYNINTVNYASNAVKNFEG